MENYIKSPLNYVGGKFKLLSQIVPLFPSDIDTFVDLFGGGFNVGINVKAKKIIYNDTIKQVVDLLENFKKRSSKEVHSTVLQVIKNYELSRSSNEIEDHNKKYLELRESYNISPSWDKLYALISCCFNSQIRFNLKEKFNVPYGKRDYNISLQEKLKAFIDKLNTIDVSFRCEDFRCFDLNNLCIRDLVYYDPPYLNSTATYNENGGWTNQDENDLLHMLNQINLKGVRFALSNNLAVNPSLEKWAEDNRYTTNYLDGSYSNCNYQKKDKKSKDIEVLITNYQI